MPKKVIGQLIEQGQQSKIIWTPNEDRKQNELMRVAKVGPEVHETAPGDVIVLKDGWVGAELTLTDDDGVLHEYIVVHENDCLMRVRDA